MSSRAFDRSTCLNRGALALFVGFVASSDALTADYPTKPIRFLVGGGPGGGSDILARLLAQKITANVGQQVVVDNRPGAGGLIATEFTAHSAPDGYTILMATNAFATAPALHAKLPYDTLRDFAPIVLIASANNLLAVHPSVPANSVADLIKLAKSKPGGFTFASGGSGQPSHLAGELFKTMAGIELIHVPYKGGGPAVGAVIAGEVSISFGSLPGLMPHVKTGRIRALAVTGSKRSANLPEIPTVGESGLRGFDVSTWFGVITSARTPRELIARINAEISKAAMTKDTRERFADLGLELELGTPEQFATLIRIEVARWTKIVGASGARAE